MPGPVIYFTLVYVTTGMTAIDPRGSARYAGRLFGYFLVVAIVGGGITAGGVALLRNNDVFSGGSIDVGAEVIVGGALAGVGVLVVLAGFFVIVLNVIADGVRYGVADRVDSRATPQPERTPAWVPSRGRRPVERTAPVARRPPGRDRDHDRQPERSRDAVERDVDEEPWKREVEEHLEDEPGRPTRGSADERGERTDEPRDVPGGSGESTARRTGSAAGHERDTATGSRGRPESAVEREPVEESRPPTGRAEPPEGDDSETWVSGDEVSGQGGSDAAGPDGSPTDDDPTATDGTETTPSDTGPDDTGSPAWLADSDEDEDEESSR